MRKFGNIMIDENNDTLINSLNKFQHFYSIEKSGPLVGYFQDDTIFIKQVLPFKIEDIRLIFNHPDAHVRGNGAILTGINYESEILKVSSVSFDFWNERYKLILGKSYTKNNVKYPLIELDKNNDENKGVPIVALRADVNSSLHFTLFSPDFAGYSQMCFHNNVTFKFVK